MIVFMLIIINWKNIYNSLKNNRNSLISEDPIPTLHCPRLNGYFSHEDPKECGIFYFCVDGKFNMITCPDGLVYNERTGICTWPDEAKKKGCGASGMY